MIVTGDIAHVVLLGAAGRLGRMLTDALPSLGWPTLGITRTGTPHCPTPVDVTDPRWSNPASWRSIIAGWPPVAAVVNLATGREPETRQAETSSRAAVAVMGAVADALDGDPFTVHLGSIAEASRMPRSAYAAGKAAARQTATTDGRVAVLTVAIVPRERGTRADRAARTLCRLSPRIALLPIPVTNGDTLARTLALLLHDRTAAGRQMVLVACPQPLGSVLGTRVLAGSLGDRAARALVASPPTRGMLGSRAVTLAQAALGSSVIEHYSAAVPHTGDLTVSTPGQLIARRNDDGLGDWWLVPADVTDRRATHV